MLLGAMSSRFAVINGDANNGLRLRTGRHAPEPESSRTGADRAGAQSLCDSAVGLVEHAVSTAQSYADGPIVPVEDDGFKYDWRRYGSSSDRHPRESGDPALFHGALNCQPRVCLPDLKPWISAFRRVTFKQHQKAGCSHGLSLHQEKEGARAGASRLPQQKGCSPLRLLKVAECSLEAVPNDFKLTFDVQQNVAASVLA